MARDGRLLRCCAYTALGLVAAAGNWTSVVKAAPGDERDGTVVATLAVQTSMQQARELLLQHKSKAAVEVLESQIGRIDGNPAYLTLLRQAYRAYIKELCLAHQEKLAQTYVKRLAVLEPDGGSAPAERAVVSSETANPATTGTGAPLGPTNAALASGSAHAAPKIVARGYREEEPEDPFAPSSADRKKSSQALLSKADQEFLNRNYREAHQLYAKANDLEKQLTDACRERWAYCKLYQVVEQLNQPAAGGLPLAALEGEVRVAMTMAPRLDYAKQLLTEIDRRKSASPAIAGAGQETTIAIRHTTSEGWNVAETANFRVFHNQPRAMAEQAARAAERVRTEMQKKWFGALGENWNPRCDLFLHATAQDYSKATSVPSTSPGHSSFRIEGSRVVGRRIDLHCDDPNLLIAVLPHETTHTVLAGNFGEKPVPRWADEGMAVLSEPREKVDRHLRNLPQHRQERQLFPLSQLLELNEYPEARYVGAFYAESVSLVDFLVKEKGPQVFSQFVRDGLRGGYEPALQRHYGYRNYYELELNWVRHAFGDGVAQR